MKALILFDIQRGLTKKENLIKRNILLIQLMKP